MGTGTARIPITESTAQPAVGELHRRITTKLSLDDLKTVCLDLNVNWDEIPGETLSGKSRELILYLDRRGRLNELNAAIAARDNSKPVRSVPIRKELRRHLGPLEVVDTIRVLRAIRRGRLSDKEVEGALEKIEPVLTEVRTNAALAGESVLPALAERVCRIIERSDRDRHKLTVALPLVPIILGSPDNLAVGDLTELKALWKELTRWWPPPNSVVIAAAMAAALAGYGVFLTAVQDPNLSDLLESRTGAAEPLNPAVWEYAAPLDWTVDDAHLGIASAGMALMKTNRLGHELRNFSLSFVIGMPEGREAAWILRAQRLAPPEQVQGYGFVLRAVGTGVYLNGQVLPEKSPLSGGGALEVGEFDPAKDMLQIEAAVGGATFDYTVRRTARAEYFKERSVTAGFGRAYSLRMRDPEARYAAGTVGLMGVPGMRVEGPFYVHPAWRWY